MQTKKKFTDISEGSVYIEGQVITGQKYKDEVYEELKEKMPEYFDEVDYRMLLEGLVEKYKSPLYGFYFHDDATQISFRPNENEQEREPITDVPEKFEIAEWQRCPSCGATSEQLQYHNTVTHEDWDNEHFLKCGSCNTVFSENI